MNDFGARMEALRKLEDTLFWERQNILLKCGWVYSATAAKAQNSSATYVKQHEGKVYATFSQLDAIAIECRLRTDKPIAKF